MAQRVIIPRMGQTMTEGVVKKWYKKDGDLIKNGEDVYELEYDKSTATISAEKSGTIKLLCEEGSAVPLGGVVAVILEKGETLDTVNIKGTHEVANVAHNISEEPKEIINSQAKVGETTKESVAPLATPMVKRLAKEMGIDIKKIVPSDPNGRLTKEDLIRFKNSEEEKEKPEVSKNDYTVPDKGLENLRISPIAKKLANQKNIDISKINPADGKRINKEDVLAYEKATYVAEVIEESSRRVPLKGMRKVISERMTQSYFTYPTVTLTTDVDMSEFLKLREQLNEEFSLKGIKLSVTHMLIKAVSKALVENKGLNISLEKDEIIYHEEINVGIAISIENGLVVPVIKKADKLKLEEIAIEVNRLIGLIKEDKLSADDMKGGTFTITNLSSVGIDSFNPIINLPESAILGVGRTVEKAVVVNGEIVIRPKCVLSLTHDHRVIDGVPGGNFLQSVIRYIEKPFLLLMD